MQVGRRLRSKLDGDDLIQETFLNAHRAIGRFRGVSEEEFLAWLRGIMAHVLAGEIRRYHGTERRDPTLELARSRPISSDPRRGSSTCWRRRRAAPASEWYATSAAVRLAEAMERLPPATREILLLRHFEDLGFPEIARRMERTLDSVKNLWFRALARLRRELDFLDERD